MSIFEYVDMWDFLALGLMIFSLWLAIWGANQMQAAGGEKVNAKALKGRALGGAAAGALYLIVHIYMIMQ